MRGPTRRNFNQVISGSINLLLDSIWRVLWEYEAFCLTTYLPRGKESDLARTYGLRLVEPILRHDVLAIGNSGHLVGWKPEGTRTGFIKASSVLVPDGAVQFRHIAVIVPSVMAS